MRSQRDEQQADPTSDAIERVLRAEQDGMRELQRTQDDVRDRLAQARTQAAAIMRRTDARITKLRSAYLEKVQRDIEELEPIPGAGAQASKLYDSTALVAATRRLAARLTGGA